MKKAVTDVAAFFVSEFYYFSFSFQKLSILVKMW